MSTTLDTGLLPRRAGAVGRERRAPAAETAGSLNAEAALLEQVMARSAGDRAPVVLLWACDGPTIALGQQLSAAAAVLLGRTLLIEVGEHDGPWGFPSRIVAERDLAIPALHRAMLGGRLVERDQTEQPIAAELEAISRAYRMVVIVCAAAGASVRSLALAPLCSGVVLVVRAGQTRMRDVDAATRAIAESGGRLLGLVLSDAPTQLPRWLHAR